MTVRNVNDLENVVGDGKIGGLIWSQCYIMHLSSW